MSVSMGRLSCGLTFGYSMDKFAEDIKARVIVVARYKWPTETLDGILHIAAMLPDQFVGVVFNRVPASKASQIEQAVQAVPPGAGSGRARHARRTTRS